MNKYLVLLKSHWGIKEIQTYYDCSLNSAEEIKKIAEVNGGVILNDREKLRKNVSADVVIQIMGGTSRLNELQIFNEYQKTCK